MCGIAGVVRRAGSPRQLSGAVRRMITLQRHRGPDGEGFYESPYAALGHCRLAILDLSCAGHQPMADVDRRFWITFNGEIYNYVELAAQLRQLGHSFRGRSDTEVLLAAYKQWGADCVHHLRGMFAFAVWDEQERKLFAARDRLGIKPFHYCVSENGTQIAFASEIKALIEFLPECRVNARLARDFIAWNLLDHDPAETMVQGILRLPAGHTLTWEHDGRMSVRCYWTLQVSEEVRSTDAERDKLVAEFREQFSESIDIHLRSDVPVGSCLSGGIDSSSIVCAVTRELKERQVDCADWQHTFSACFEEPSLDERRYIDAVTSATHSQNHQVFPSGSRLAEEMDAWLWHQEEPVGGFGVYAQYCVARLAREHGIKVLLDGQGADEQLLGYRKFVVAYVRQLMEAGDYWRASCEATAYVSSRDGFAGSPLIEGIRYLNRVAPDSPRLWNGTDAPERPAALGLAPPLGRRIHADITKFSLPVLLRFEDRNSMAFGIESRVPFVDHVLVEWIARLPADLRIRNGWTKKILRDAMADVLPPVVRYRKSKLGFTTPDAKWLRGPLKQWLVETLSRPVHLLGLVDTGEVARLLDAHRAERSSNRSVALLFRLAMFEQWARAFLRTSAGMAVAIAAGQ